MADITNWLPAISTTSLFALALWLFRSWISARLTKSIENEFNEKIENLKSELRTKESTIESLRSAAMSGLVSRQAKLYERQLEAIDQIWEAVTELGKAKGISVTMAIVKYEEAAKEAAANPRFRQVFEIMGAGFDVKNIKLGTAAKARPFLTPLAWAYYNAYQAIILLDVMKFETLRLGLESPERFINIDGVKDIVKAVLPHHSDYLDKFGSGGLHFLLDEIERLLLVELQNIQKGIIADQENTERAAEILKASNKVIESITKETSKA
ncbi:hypothetical protein [Thermosulfurimonas sp. F29]|uniref:hypothetical protein n=1 Tax=Thermosulfurimonas sp. F29 TaxID=2867247 RepID=UPI001C82AB7B|nr:hypothetical protein [Thermosulfurimonas sp. F29]MBX6421994.1 hypothetical protein [Thermosulfurimonas sp. F29]